jgi:hypothetical protein
LAHLNNLEEKMNNEEKNVLLLAFRVISDGAEIDRIQDTASREKQIDKVGIEMENLIEAIRNTNTERSEK